MVCVPLFIVPYGISVVVDCGSAATVYNCKAKFWINAAFDAAQRTQLTPETKENVHVHDFTHFFAFSFQAFLFTDFVTDQERAVATVRAQRQTAEWRATWVSSAAGKWSSCSSTSRTSWRTTESGYRRSSGTDSLWWSPRFEFLPLKPAADRRWLRDPRAMTATKQTSLNIYDRIW